MRITDVQVNAYSKRHETPIRNGKYTYAATNLVFVQVETDAGITGIGWAHGGEIVYTTAKLLVPHLIGEDPRNTERIFGKLYLPKIFGRKGMETRAISAVDIACWDIIGKSANMPLCQLLGGFRDAVPFYVAGGYYYDRDGIDRLKAEMEGHLALNPTGVKMKIGRATVAEDIRRIEAVRSVVGDGVEILVDANNAYSRSDALKMGRALDRLGVYWFEEPLAPDDVEGSAELARQLDTPIANGENEYTRWGFRDLIAARSLDVVNADAQILGGITEWRKVAAYASAHHLPVAPHGDQEIHVHLVAASDNGLIVEYYEANVNLLRNEMIHRDLRRENGQVYPSRKPGLGVEIDFAAGAPYRVG